MCKAERVGITCTCMLENIMYGHITATGVNKENHPRHTDTHVNLGSTALMNECDRLHWDNNYVHIISFSLTQLKQMSSKMDRVHFLRVHLLLKVQSKKFHFKPQEISGGLSMAAAIATAAVIPVSGKHSANYRCHQCAWKRLCTASKGKPLKPQTLTGSAKVTSPNSWSQRGPFNYSRFSSPTLFCPVPNFKCADLRPMGDLDPVPSRWKIQLTCSSSCRRYNSLP